MKQADIDEHIEVLKDIARERGDTFRDDYAGRGMFDKRCVGIVTDEPLKVVEDAAEEGIRGAKMDGMGKQTIVYWPKLSVAP
jgi:hypothetical protein